MSAHNIRRSAGRTFEIYAVYGISVEGVIDRSVLDACRDSERIAGYRQIRLRPSGDCAPEASRCWPRLIIRTLRSCWPT
jgi:hypothetical protein